MNKHTLVMGIGNTLRADDGIGAAVIDALQTAEIPSHVELLDAGTPGFDLTLLMSEYSRVIVIDAAELLEDPGIWKQFTPDEVRLGSGDLHLRGTLHYAGLAEAMNLAAAMDLLPDEIIILGIQPESMEWEIGLTPDVAAVVPDVAARVLTLLQDEPVFIAASSV
jgi:hydrogenase maturation protease